MATVVTRRAILGLYAAAVGAQTLRQTTPEQEWRRFLDWFRQRQAEPSQNVVSVLETTIRDYRTKLLGEGLPSADLEQLVARIRTGAQQSQEFSNLLFNKMYTAKTPGFSDGPSSFLAEVTADLKPGDALDIGMGDGRNSLFLAKRGWNVTGIDLAEVGIDKARKKAAALGVTITALAQDANAFSFGESRWDLVCLLYFSGYGFVQNIEKRLAASLKPGGYVLSEGASRSANDMVQFWRNWEPFGLTTRRLEFHAEKAEWGQPNFSRMLLQKVSPG